MKGFIRLIKKALGFCEFDKCWKRATASMTIGVNKKVMAKRCICSDHINKVIKDSDSDEIIVEVE